LKGDKMKKARLNVHIEKDLKDRFLKVAKANDSDASKLIRAFIREYLRKNSQTQIKFKS